MISVQEYRVSRVSEAHSLTDLQFCSAETAECNCPEACERDHGND